MAHGTSEPIYFVDRTGPVDDEIRQLIQRATTSKLRRSFFRTMRKVVKNLMTRPLEWGDPEHRTRKEGGVVCHGIMPPLILRYVVFEPEKVVVILRIKALPGSALA